MSLAPPEPSRSELLALIGDRFVDRAVTPEPLILQSWYRSIAEHGLDPDRPVAAQILPADRIRQHQAELEDYLMIARQGVSGLARRVADAGFAVVLSDAAGVALDVRLPPADQAFSGSGLAIGACWDESVAGTNGIGTALAAGSALTIHRQEHFLSRHARLSCSVAPLFDCDGRLMGCLNATTLGASGPKAAQSLTLQLVTLYARMIENAHFRQRFRGQVSLSVKPRDRISDLASERLIAVDESGAIIGANHAAFRAYRSLGQALLGAPIERLLATDLDELLALSDGGTRGVRIIGPHDEGPLDIGLEAAPRPVSRPAVRRTATGSPRHPDLAQLCGDDPGLRRNVERVRRVLDRDIPILLTGETGSGKEAFARAIHAASARRHGAFVALNCAAIPESLIESELFGYRGGSFTGANRKGMKGKLELANGGTLFLDEIGDMPAHLQTRLLRVLAERELLPLGAETPVPLNVQVISATHQDLDGMIASRQFREDLFYRLNGMRLSLPPLRERQDLGLLIERLLHAEDANCRLAEGVLARLVGYHWPGNVRQLINTLRYAVALADGGLIDHDCLPAELERRPPASSAPTAREGERLHEALRRARWNISEVAAELGVARSTLYRRMKKHGIVAPNAVG
ncbi:sigma-54-dependent Fis family transcriptional regulator [Stutzerimonas urumqiensis]|uniref:sigma-54-dependent Fis family transcriptional regulator n=1 Tax=Stutzerimonas urumqiensis TaxID=638269 RepID=UPI003DA1D76C